MSQEKAQLIAPIGIMTVSGMTATGVITASSFTGNIVGSAKSLVNGTDVTAGVVTATSFVGNLTGNIQRLADSAPNINVGVTTATSFVGNLTGSVTDLTSQPDITVGLVTATSLSGPITGNVTGNVVGNVTGNVTGTIAGDVTGDVTGNATGTSGGLGINYNGGWTGAGTSQVRVGVVTATSFYGDGSNLEGVSSGPVSQQSVGITSAATSIDLSNGNLIYATQSADTTVSFANTANGNVYFIRTKDDNTTARTITWPDRIKWNGGTAPTLLDNPRAGDAQVFLLVTRDMGVTWYGKEVVSFDPQTFTLLTWGQNSVGQLGLNDILNRSSPTQVGELTTWSNTAGQQMNHSGDQSAAVLKTDGTLWSMGQSFYGNLGLNDVISRSSPTQISGTTWSSWSMGYQGSTITTKTDGTLWTFGKNLTGQLGHNSRTSVSSPTQIPGSWVSGDSTKIATNIVSGAINASGELYVWGYNSNGELAQNDRNARSSPTRVGTDTTWKSFDIEHTAAGGIKTNGTLWTWGDCSARGLLGLNQNDTDRSSPTQVGTDTTWSQFTWGNTAGIAIKTDGTLWSWGYNSTVGLLGLNDKVNRSSPTQIGTDTNWSQVNGPIASSFAALKTDGSLWVWGDGSYYGNLGLNESTSGSGPFLSSPTQLPGTYERIISNTRGFTVLKQ